VITLLRFIAVMNAAVWFGAAVFFTFVAAPAFFSNEMGHLLPRVYVGAALQIVLERYFLLQNWCGAIALVHLISEWLYTGRPMPKLTLYLLIGMFSLGLLGGQVLEPYMKKLHAIRYVSKSLVEQEQAARSFGLWHGVSQVMNLVVLAGLLVYLWQVTHPPNTPRFSSTNKFRG